MRKFIILSTVTNLIFLTALQAQSDSLALARIQQLEVKVQTLSDSLNQYKKLIEDYKTINQAAEMAKEFIEHPVRSLFTYGTILLVGFAALLWLFFWLLRKTTPKWFTSLIQQWVEKYEEVSQLKEKKSVLVISSEAFSNQDFIMKLMRKKGFKKVAYARGMTAAKEKLNNLQFDVIFANNEDETLAQDDLQTLMSQHSYPVLFYYGKSGTWDFRKSDSNIQNRLNLANSRAQVYGNLISSMNYHDTIQ